MSEEETPTHRWATMPKLLAALVILVVVVVMALRTGSAKHDFVQSFRNFGEGKLIWLAGAITAEAIAVSCYGLAQRRLLIAGGASISRHSAAGLGLGATGIAALVPFGVLPASGWLIAQYRLRSITFELALWTVLASGFVATVTILAFFLVGAGIAEVGNPLLLLASGLVLVFGSAGFVALVHRIGRVEHFLSDHKWQRGARLVHRIVVKSGAVARRRAGWRAGSEVFAYSAVNWIADAVALVCSFGLIGQPLPWASALFAFSAAQVAGSISPLPAGLGVVEGGLVGAFSLAGIPAGRALAATVIYRVVGYWGLAGAGSLVVFFMSHHLAPKAKRTRRHPSAVLPPEG